MPRGKHRILYAQRDVNILLGYHSNLIKNLCYVLDDFVEISEFNVTTEGIKKCAQHAIEASQTNHQIKYLAIVPTDLLYGMVRMWQAYSDVTGWQMNIVRDREEAQNWIEKHVPEKLP